jgi:hypothetical protein
MAVEVSQEVGFLHDRVSLKPKDLHQFGEVLPSGLRVFDDEDFGRLHFFLHSTS